VYGGMQGALCDVDTVVDLIALAQSAQDRGAGTLR
jgi:hypothetical protein